MLIFAFRVERQFYFDHSSQINQTDATKKCRKVENRIQLVTHVLIKPDTEHRENETCNLHRHIIKCNVTGSFGWIRRYLSLIHISEPTRLGMISYAVFCLKKKKQ